METQVYERESNGITYWSTKAPSPAVKFKKAQIQAMGPELYQQILDRNTTPEATVGTEALARTAALISIIGPMFNETKAAREELTITALNEGMGAEEVKDLAGVSWAVLKGWCESTKDGKTKVLVPKDSYAKITDEAKKAADARAASTSANDEEFDETA